MNNNKFDNRSSSVSRQNIMEASSNVGPKFSYFASANRSSSNSVNKLSRKRAPSGQNPYFENQMGSLGKDDHFQNFYNNP